MRGQHLLHHVAVASNAEVGPIFRANARTNIDFKRRMQCAALA